MSPSPAPSIVLYAEDAFPTGRAVGVASLRPPVLERVRRSDPAGGVWLIAVDPASVAVDGRIPVASSTSRLDPCASVALISDGAGGLAEIAPALSVSRVDVPAGQACLARSQPGHTQLGPSVAAPDRLDSVGIELRINGTPRQIGSLGDLVVAPGQLLASIGRYVTLAPGDLVLIGAPEGTAADRGDGWAMAGDRIEVTLLIDGGTVDLACRVEAGAGPETAGVHRPRILCVGSNYRSHLAEMGAGAPAVPSLNLLKLPGSRAGDGDEIEIHPDWRVDYEGEIAVVIGQILHDVEPGEVLRSDVSLCLANDVSAREAPMTHLTIAKSAPGFCPIGAGPVPISALDLATLDFSVEVNGEVRQHGRAKDLVFPIPEIISSISRSTVLRPGDIVLTGSPAGVGAVLEPQRFLVPGDEVRVRSAQLGEMTNRFVAPGTRPAGAAPGRRHPLDEHASDTDEEAS